MQWDKTELAYLALPTCSTCHGTGLRREEEGGRLPCRCALRAMFRACYARFRSCAESSKHRSRVSFDRTISGRSNRGAWGRKEEEYMADFELVSRRVLDDWHYRLFRYHFLLGADWRLCCRKLQVSRGNFFHGVYRIEAKLGEALATLRPYGLYPPRDYFVYRLPEPVRSCRAEAKAPARAAAAWGGSFGRKTA